MTRQLGMGCGNVDIRFGHVATSNAVDMRM